MNNYKKSKSRPLLIGAASVLVLTCGVFMGYALGNQKNGQANYQAQILSQNEKPNENMPDMNEIFGDVYTEGENGNGRFDADFNVGDSFSSTNLNGIQIQDIYNTLSADQKQTLQRILGMSDAELSQANWSTLLKKAASLGTAKHQELMTFLQDLNLESLLPDSGSMSGSNRPDAIEDLPSDNEQGGGAGNWFGQFNQNQDSQSSRPGKKNKNETNRIPGSQQEWGTGSEDVQSSATSRSSGIAA